MVLVGHRLRRRPLISVALLLTGLAVFSLPDPASPQELMTDYEALGIPVLEVDHAGFWASRVDKVTLELYYQVAVSALKYVKTGDNYTASYHLSVVVKDRKGRQVNGDTFEGSFSVDEYPEFGDERIYRGGTVSFDLFSGNYKVEFRLTDKNSGQVVSVDRGVKLRHPGYDKPSISDILFATEDSDSAEAIEVSRGGVSFVPSVIRQYSSGDSNLAFYCELYNLPSGEIPVEIRYEVRNIQGKTVISGSKELTPAGRITPFYSSIPIGELGDGHYKLKLSMSKVDVEAGFSIVWSLDAAFMADFDRAMEQLRYIASPDEIDTLRAADEENRAAVWDAFWSRRDPTPGTSENELKGEFYRRVRYANEHFGFFNREGWKTDFGRIYIIYGPPNEVERHVFDLDSKPYEIWYYFRLEKRFVFVDENGYGQYELQFPYTGEYYR